MQTLTHSVSLSSIGVHTGTTWNKKRKHKSVLMSVAGVWNKLDTHSIIFLTWRIVATGFVAGCRKMMIFCHNIIYGSFCVYKVIKYCVEYLDYCDDAIIKKIFINTFNHALEFYTFRQMKKKVHRDWVFHPFCMQDYSYGYRCMPFFVWAAGREIVLVDSMFWNQQ